MDRQPKRTAKVPLPGGQDRLRQLVLYVADQCQSAKRFGAIKLNKILWKADFTSFAARRRPVTGREYRRQRFGPVPHEMLRLHREMLESGLIRIEIVDFGDDVVENRTVALARPDLSCFDAEDLAFVDAAIHHYWDLTGRESSDDSHGVAWQTREDGELMPYEAAFLSDAKLPQAQRLRLLCRAATEGWVTQ